MLRNSSDTAPTCLMLGIDGYDPCVTANLILLYTTLGFNVFLGKEPYPADLIVWTRYGSDGAERRKELFSKIASDTPIHIYSYVGRNPDLIAPELDRFPVSVFAPSEKLLSSNQRWYQQIVLPPVFSQLWSKSDPERVCEVVHIGNYKARNEYEAGWEEQQYLVQAVCSPRVHVWGTLGWENVSGIKNWHGELPLFSVPEVYARSEFALGLMYPFQIESETYSSRFWQAPLCGAKLICETDVRQVFPGIYPVGLKNWEVKLTWFKEDSELIREQAVAFWDAKLKETAAAVFESLSFFPSRRDGKSPESMLPMPNPYQAFRNNVFTGEYLYIPEP
jgi:hypothetical protein